MDNENTVAAEPSIGDLRAMLGGKAPEVAKAPPAEGEAQETPAPDAQAEGEPAPDSEPVVNSGVERGTDGKFKADPDPPGVKKRIGKALEAQRKAEERASAAEAEIERLKSGSQPAKETAQPEVTVIPETRKKPDVKDFETYELYNEALVDWKLEQKEASKKATEDRQTAADRQVAALTTWNDRVAKTAKVHADYEDVMAEAGEIPISKAMHDTIFSMERGPEVAYFLAKNPAEATRIAKLDGNLAAAELGAIRASLAKPATAAAAAGGKQLPKPATPIGGGASPHTVNLNDPKLSMKDFKSEMQKRLKKDH